MERNVWWKKFVSMSLRAFIAALTLTAGQASANGNSYFGANRAHKHSQVVGRHNTPI
jgi:hypothetical protein